MIREQQLFPRTFHYCLLSVQMKYVSRTRDIARMNDLNPLAPLFALDLE